MTLKKKTLENSVGKEENAGNEHFLLFPKCFQAYLNEKLSFQEHSICRPQILQFGHVQKFVVW